MTKSRRATLTLVPLLLLALTAYIGTATAAPSALTAAAPTPPPSQPYATILFGRAAWVGANNCKAYPLGVNLGTAVQWLSTLGIPAVGGVVTGYTQETEETCRGASTLYPSWQQLEALHTSYGFEAISQSATYGGWEAATSDPQIQNESCDTLSTFEAHGFNRASGMFDFPDNKYTDEQQAVVSSCFDFSRRYGTKPTAKGQAVKKPHIARAVSVTSGNCNNASLPCYTAFAGGKHYMMPSTVIPTLNPANNQYGIVQFYRFVSGSNSAGDTTWDCTSPSAADHWVSRPEVYCYNDFQTIVAGRSSGALFTDPETVASGWGITPG